MKELRIGHGYDVHRLISGRKLFLGGVEIDFTLGLEGHSDADVLIHAACDAVLGALGKGDIGRHFPDTEDSYKGISSIFFANSCRNIMFDAGYEISNMDITVIAQKPKLAPYIPSMIRKTAEAFSASPDDINIKATTEEKLGFTGRMEGIACHCVVLLRRRSGQAD